MYYCSKTHIEIKMSLKLILPPQKSRELIIFIFSTFNFQTQRFKTEDEKPQKVHHTENQNRRSDSPTKQQLDTVSLFFFCFYLNFFDVPNV